MVLEDMNVEDVDLLWCINEAMRERDWDALIIIGYLGNMHESDRYKHIDDILWS